MLRWVRRNTKPVSALADPRVIRGVLDALATKLDGTPAAPTVVNRKRAVLTNAIGYAVELDLLPGNPIATIMWRAPKVSPPVDRRSVVNPLQAGTRLAAVAAQPRSGPRLVAFFGVMYFAALRPEEAVNLRATNLDLPVEGWGELHLERSSPYAGREWTDNNSQRDDRQLKHRAEGEVRTVPCPPELTRLLQAHLTRFGTDSDERVFHGERGGVLASITYTRAWGRARRMVFTSAVYKSPLARRPYDLRHAAVSTWLNGGVPAPQVAEWAGHSVAVLLEVYAKCIEGQHEAAKRRVEEALSWPSASGAGRGHALDTDGRG